MPDDISIVGGGASVRHHDLNAIPGTVICVNDAALHSPRCDIIVSMDRMWLENRWAALEHLALPTFVRLTAMRNMLENIYSRWVHPFDNRHEHSEFGIHPCSLNGPNSGHCALNLAFVMRPKRIHLYGFDMARGQNGEAYWFPPYSWVRRQGATANKRYDEWAVHLDHGIRQCEGVGIEVIRHGRLE